MKYFMYQDGDYYVRYECYLKPESSEKMREIMSKMKCNISPIYTTDEILSGLSSSKFIDFRGYFRNMVNGNGDILEQLQLAKDYLDLFSYKSRIHIPRKQFDKYLNFQYDVVPSLSEMEELRDERDSVTKNGLIVDYIHYHLDDNFNNILALKNISSK